MSDRKEGGFALALVLFVMVITGVIIAGGTFIATQEIRIGSANREAAEAFYLAERGLSGTMANWSAATYGGLAMWADTTLSDSLEAGLVSTKVTRIGTKLYLLEATSTVKAGATRETGMVVRLSTAEVMPDAALTTQGVVEIKGTAEVHGEDQVPPGWGVACTGLPLEDKPGIQIDDATNVNSKAGAITGNPMIQQDATIDESTFTQFGELNWEALTGLADKVLPGGTINGTAPVDVAGTCSRTVSTNWGDPDNPAAPCGNYFPVIHITGSATIQSGGVGQGILLVDESLSLRGNFTFNGIIIVQGGFATEGSGNRVFGGVMAGNADFDDQALVGGSVVQNSSCAVARALMNNEALYRPRQLPDRGWVDISAIGG